MNKSTKQNTKAININTIVMLMSIFITLKEPLQTQSIDLEKPNAINTNIEININRAEYDIPNIDYNILKLHHNINENDDNILLNELSIDEREYNILGLESNILKNDYNRLI